MGSLISFIPWQKYCSKCSFLLMLLRLAVVLKAATMFVMEVKKLVGEIHHAAPALVREVEKLV